MRRENQHRLVLALLFLVSAGTPSDAKATTEDATAASWRQAAAQGSATAQYMLGYAYEQGGHGLGPDNYSEARTWYLKAAEQAHPQAMFRLGLLYENGRGIPKDSAVAILWYEKAAKAGNTDAVTTLNNIRITEESEHRGPLLPEPSTTGGLTREETKGAGAQTTNAQPTVDAMRAAAEHGDVFSQLMLGQAYEQGSSGVKLDYAEALKWYLKAAAQAQESNPQIMCAIQAMWAVGGMYEHGLGVKKNKEEAVRWYNKAASASARADKAQQAQAALNLRNMQNGGTNSNHGTPTPDSSTGGEAADASDASIIKKIKPEVVKSVSKATVIIETPLGSGSGFYYKDGNDFWIASNTHVIGGAFDLLKLKVFDQNGKQVPVEKEIKADLEADLCLVKLPKDTVPECFVVQGKDPSPGDPILVTGNAKGDGIISPLEGVVKGLGAKHGVPIFEISAPIVPGCSGGPVVNENGEVIGVSTYGITASEEIKNDKMFKGTPFAGVRRMAVRTTRLSDTKPCDPSVLFLHHKATHDRDKLLELYLQCVREKYEMASKQEMSVRKRQWADMPDSQSQFNLDDWLATADKPIMDQGMFNGVRKSGMLEEYYTAGKILSQLNGLWTKEAEDAGRISKKPMHYEAQAKTIREQIAKASASMPPLEINFLNKLKTKKDAVFIDKEVHDSIDAFIETRLKELSKP